jgi:transcriptional regulator with GAF, ATPase, and Fis domain
MDKKKTDFAHRVQSETDEYIREILAQTQKLRTVAASLQAEKERLEGEVAGLRRELDRQRAEGDRLQNQLLDISRQNQQSLDRYQAVAAQNASLANLYVATYQLHSSADRDQVFAGIREVVANLIGCEEVAIYEMNDGDGALRLATWFGIPAGRLTVTPADGIIGWVVSTGTTYVAGEQDDAPAAREGEQDLSACVPLKVDDRVLGVVALFRLLPQKFEGFNELDRELLNLLATHGATALYLSRLRAGDETEA